jgi:predicted PurR-regulated permease PerM
MDAPDPTRTPTPPGCPEQPWWRRPRTALFVLAVVALLALLYVGSAFFIPVVASLTLAAVLDPVQRRLARGLRSRALAALTAVVVSLALVVAAGSAVVVQLADTTERWPKVLRLAARDIGQLAQPGGATMKDTRQALAELDRTVARVTGDTPPPRAAEQKPGLVTEVVDWARQRLVASTLSAFELLLQIGVIALMTFFMLCSGEPLVRRVCAWADDRAPATARARATVLELARQVRLYGRVLLVTNGVLGLGVAAGLAAFGVPAAWAWGLVAAALHFVPYAGMAVLMALAAIEVYAAQSSLAFALLAAAYVGLLGVVVGTAMTAWMQSRAAKVDSALLFVGTVFWAVMWGGWGLVLGPVLVVALHVATGQRLRAPAVAAPLQVRAA